MKRGFLKIGLVGIIVATVTIAFCFTALADDKKKFIFGKKDIKHISSVNLNAFQDKNKWYHFSVLKRLPRNPSRPPFFQREESS